MASAPSAAPRRAPPAWTVPLFLGLIALAAVVAYRDSFAVPFLFDDQGSVVENPSIRHFGTALFPPRGGWPVSGRPLFNFSLAVNYALSRGRTWSYHALNLLIHVLAGWTLFGVVRRTLAGLAVRAGEGREAEEGWIAEPDTAGTLAFAVALLWTVHPLQTEAVTYLSQRAESLMGLFYLLTFYGFIRYVESSRVFAASSGSGAQGMRPKFWAAFSVVACFLGVASKETTVTAPILLLLYDRTFVVDGFREAWRRRRGYYLALAASWLALAGLVASTGARGGTAGFGSSVAWWAYAFTQVRAVPHYLRLCLWPRPLVFDYGLILGGPPLEMAADGAVLIALLAATAVLVRRGSRWGFLGAWYFLILAPTSSIMPISTELIAEHRVYLSLAAVVVAVVCGGAVTARRWGLRRGVDRRRLAAGGWVVLAVAAVALVTATYARNRTYRSLVVFWQDAAEKEPDNAGALNNYGNALVEDGRNEEAEVQFEAALRLVPKYDEANYDLGNVLTREGRWAEAVPHYLAALPFRPETADWHYALGNAYVHLGRQREADEQYEQALTGVSPVPGVWYNLGNAFLEENKLPEAEKAYAKALALEPNYADALVNEAGVLAQLGRGDEAVRAFQAALRLEPGAADVHNNLGGLLAEAGRLDEARTQFAEALRLKPDYREASDNLARVEAMERGRAQP